MNEIEMELDLAPQQLENPDELIIVIASYPFGFDHAQKQIVLEGEVLSALNDIRADAPITDAVTAPEYILPREAAFENRFLVDRTTAFYLTKVIKTFEAKDVRGNLQPQVLRLEKGRKPLVAPPALPDVETQWTKEKRREEQILQQHSLYLEVFHLQVGQAAYTESRIPTSADLVPAVEALGLKVMRTAMLEGKAGQTAAPSETGGVTITGGTKTGIPKLISNFRVTRADGFDKGFADLTFPPTIQYEGQDLKYKIGAPEGSPHAQWLTTICSDFQGCKKKLPREGDGAEPMETCTCLSGPERRLAEKREREDNEAAWDHYRNAKRDQEQRAHAEARQRESAERRRLAREREAARAKEGTSGTAYAGLFSPRAREGECIYHSQQQMPARPRLQRPPRRRTPQGPQGPVVHTSPHQAEEVRRR